MKVVILAGGFGTRISEESVLKPKPMVEIGDKPILWHIMKLYSYYGYNEFVICCGYKQHMIKEWFADYYLHILIAGFAVCVTCAFWNRTCQYVIPLVAFVTVRMLF